MKQLHSHSKNSLFLLEMIFVLLFLSLSSAACIRIFAAAEKNHALAKETREIQALTVSVSEIMEGSSCTPDSFTNYLSGGIIEDSAVNWYYDSTWKLCDNDNAVYQMHLELTPSHYEKQGTLSFYRLQPDNVLIRSVNLCFPSVQSNLEEEVS